MIPFKKGPDYIDAAWLALAAATSCYNLDTFLMGRIQVARSFSRHASSDAISLIEGNRGLYDGANAGGEHSTAELAKLIKAPVVLVIDCDKVTRTAAAMVLGCQRFDPEVDIRGCDPQPGGRKPPRRDCSQVGRRPLRYFRSRHRAQDGGYPFFGKTSRVDPAPGTRPDPVRHLQKAADIAENYLDLEGLIQIAKSAPPWEDLSFPEVIRADEPEEPVTIGVIRDRAFQFYYPENIEALVERGSQGHRSQRHQRGKAASRGCPLYRGRFSGDAGRASCRQ